MAKGLLSREGLHFFGWDRLCGMRGCELGTFVGFDTWAYALWCYLSELRLS